MLKRLIGKWAAAVADVCEHERDAHQPHWHHHGGSHHCGCDRVGGGAHSHERPRRGPCSIEETVCPPRCAGHIAWKVERGATAFATLEVRNVGTAARTFKFAATALAGPEPGAAALTVAPASAHLAPGERAVVSVKLEHSNALSPLQTYLAEISITGSWEQAVRVAVQVERDPFSTVSLEHGDFSAQRHDLGHAESAVAWSIQRGVMPTAVVVVNNGGSAAHRIELEATPLVGLDGGGANLVFNPTSLDLSPGQSGTASLELRSTSNLRPGQHYRAELIVRGPREQRVAVKCHVEHDPSAHCSVEQGDAPTRKRAHHWTDHFQCTDACAGT